MEEKEDRLSDLPDPLVHYILSFLPSTKEAIQTSVLSKRRRHQWTHVPNLIFDFSDSGMTSDFSPENISHITSTVSKIIDDTLALHDCSKPQKFHITFECYDHTQDPNYDAKLRFATRKQAEDLILECRRGEWLRLPSFFFRQTSLVKLRLFYCSIMPMGMVQFESLKDLFLQRCYGEYEAIRVIVSGSPLLQSLEIWYCYGSNPLVISSKSLKKLVLIDISWYVDISCPNLVEFQVRAAYCCISGWCETVLEELLSESPLLESLEWEHFEVPKLRIASKILKKLALTGMIPHEIEISCPFLEELDLSGYMMNPPSSARAALDLNTYNEGSRENVARQILEQLQHLNKLKLGSSFIEILSALEMSGLSYPLLNHKSLTLEGPIFAHIPGIVCALRSSPVLERLVVKLQPCKYFQCKAKL